MPKPPHRPPGRGGGTKTILTWACLLILTAALQPQSLHDSKKAETIVASTQTPNPEAHARRAPAGRSPAEIPLLKHDITTVKFRSTDDDATTHQLPKALAPAQVDSVVRAPLAKSAESSSGLSASSARLLQDWEAEDIVLLATIDGTLHARGRRDGKERWSLGIPTSPMIQTIHHCFNKTEDREGQCDLDYIFIVEPTQDGNIYIQHKDPRVGLQKIGRTVKQLAIDTPQVVDAPPLATFSYQQTSAYVVDAASGNILQQFSRDSSFVNDNQEKSCRRLSGFELDDPACDPIGTINLGRVEYTIEISNKLTTEPLCTIKFNEWVANKGDYDLQNQYDYPLDSTHIQTFYNGRIIGFKSKTNAEKVHDYTHMLKAPVARVFDIVRPLDNKDEAANLVLLSRPLDSPALAPAQFWRDDDRSQRVFVGRTEEGAWYAMSEASYPGVTLGADMASPRWQFDPGFIDFKKDMDDIVGVHVLSNHPEPLPVRLTIDGRPPTTDLQEEAGKNIEAPNNQSAVALLTQLGSNWSLVVNVILFGLFLLVTGIQLRVPAMLRLQRWLRQKGVDVNLNVNQSLPAEPTMRDASAPKVATVTPVDKPAEGVTEIIADAVEPVIRTPARSRAQTVDTHSASPQKESKMEEENEEADDADSDEEEDAGAAEGGNDNGLDVKRKRKKRGKRGGRKNKKKASMDPGAMDETQSLTPEVPTKDGLLQVGRLRIDTKEEQCLGRGSNGTAVYPGTLDGREVAVKRLIRSSNSLAAKEIKHLLSSDENLHVIRYFGKEESHHFTYIALDLFTTSLDQFIERPAQYPTLVKPEGFDVKDCLTQITDGVSHLHSLKLVHRDIKPQNVLVKAVKSSRPQTGLPKLHFVISDFGLCKPLEDGPESAFAPTANHTAAGTTGWRAPELLVNYRDGVAAAQAQSNQSRSTTHSMDGGSNDTVLDPPSGRRATKAIDIFSLGCVFYYVMTAGRHPFDIGGTSLGRDLNIKENRFSTDDLRLHNYQYDADDLVMQMLKHDPKERPDTTAILKHPYFWPVEDKLEFLCDVSDCYEKEKNSISNFHDAYAIRTPGELESLEELAALEAIGPNVIGPTNDFLRALPRSFINEMGKQRKYTGSRMIDLLRVIRNKKNHFHDLPTEVKEMMYASAGNDGGGVIGGYYGFWAKRFPSLLVNCHCLLIERGIVGRFGLERYC